MSTPTPVNAAEAYQAYFVPAMFVPWAEMLLDRAAPQPGEHVLDVACGTGVVARMAAPFVGPRGRVVGVDVNPAMLAVARGLPPVEGGAAIEWREESALTMALPDRSFDLALCQQGLQFFPDPVAGAREMRRVLKPDGRTVVMCNQSLEGCPAFEALIRAEARHLGLPVSSLSRPFALGDAERLRDIFAQAGFEHVVMTAHTSIIRFPQAVQFVHLSIESASAVIPELGQMTQDARAQLSGNIARELQSELEAFIDGDALAAPMAVHIVLARHSEKSD